MNRPRLNIRLFAILCLLALVTGVSLFFLHSYQVKHQADANLKQARRYCKQADDETDPVLRFKISIEGIKSYRKYLQSHPENVDVQVEEATFLIDQGKWIWDNGEEADAIALFNMSSMILERALRQAENRKDIREKFVDILFDLGDYSTAVQHIRFLCDFPKDQKALEKVFDRYDLWDRAVAAGKVKVGSGNDRDLSLFLTYDRKTVNHDQLLNFLGDDMWTIMEDPKLLGILGQCQFISNNPQSAIKSLEKSVTLGPDNLDAYDALIKALRQQNRSKDAEYWLAEVVDANPDMFRAYLIRGYDYLNRSRALYKEDAAAALASAEWDALKAAQKATQQLLESADQIIPNASITKTLNQDFNVATNLAPASGTVVTEPYRDALLKTITNVGPAAELMKKTLSNEEKESKQDSGTHNAKNINTVSPETLIKKDLEGCRDGLLLAVGCEIQKSVLDAEKATQHIGAARDLAKAVLSMFPKDDKVYLTLADIELQANNPDKMIDWMIQGTQNAKENTWLLWRLGTALAHTGKTKEAQDILKQLRVSDAKKMMVLHLEATLDMQTQNWSAAATKLEKVRPELVSNPGELRKIDILLANCYGELGRLDDQREAFARAASFDRTWGPALVGLAKSRAASGKLEEAIKDYEVILRLPNPAPERRLEYARLLLQAAMKKPKEQRNFAPIEDAIEQATTALPNKLLAPMLQAELLIAKGEIGKARNLLTGLHSQIGDAKEKILQKRKTLLKEAESSSDPERLAKLKEAKELLANAQSYDAQKTLIWTKLVGLASQEGDWEAADEALQQAQAKIGDSPNIRWLKAQKLFRQSGQKAVTALHSLAENTDGFERTEKLNLFRRLAAMAIQLDDISQAEKLAKEVLDAEPSDIEMQKVLFQVAQSEKNFDAMESVLDNIRKTEGTASAFWHYGEGIRLYMLSQEVENPKLANDAINLLSKASRMEPLWPGPTLLLAQILQEQGKLSEATDLYLDAVRNGMQNPTVIRNVASLLTKQHRFQEADEMFNRLSQFRDDKIQGMNLSASYVKAQLGDFTQSVSMAREACANSNNYQDFLWLGRVLEVSSKRASEENREAESQKLYNEAEHAFLKATELDPSAPDAWIGLVQFYGLFDKKEEAAKTLEQAKSAIPTKEVDLTLAQAYETLGEIKKAAMYYRKAIRSAPKDVNIARIATLFFLKNDYANESQVLLKRIADKQIEANDQQVAWAKRTLGLMLLREKGSSDITKTLKLIDENLKNNPNSVLDLYAKATLLANDPTGVHQGEAIALLERIQSQNRDPGIIIQQELANLYYETERWSEFKEMMRNILSKAGDHPQVVGKYILQLSEHGEYSEANVWLERLKNIAPDSPNTFLTECDLIFAQNQYDVLLEMLNDWVKKDTKELSHVNRLRNAATMCQRYAFRLASEKNKKTPTGRFERQAEDFMKKFIELKPEAEPSLAVLYAQQNQFDKAVFALQKLADKLNPDQFGQTVYIILTEGDLPESQISQVQTMLERISKAHPDNVFTKMMLAFCAEELGQANRAEEILRETLRKHPGNVDLMNYLAVTLALHDTNLDEARQLIEKAIETAGPKPDLLDSRAMVSLAQNRPKAAISDLQQAITEKPSASFYFHLAESLQREGLRKAAQNALEKAKKLGFRETSLSPVERRNYRRLKLSLQ